MAKKKVRGKESRRGRVLGFSLVSSHNVTVIDWLSTKGCIVIVFEGTTPLWTANQYSKSKKISNSICKALVKTSSYSGFFMESRVLTRALQRNFYKDSIFNKFSDYQDQTKMMRPFHRQAKVRHVSENLSRARQV